MPSQPNAGCQSTGYPEAFPLFLQTACPRTGKLFISCYQEASVDASAWQEGSPFQILNRFILGAEPEVRIRLLQERGENKVSGVECPVGRLGKKAQTGFERLL